MLEYSALMFLNIQHVQAIILKVTTQNLNLLAIKSFDTNFEIQLCQKNTIASQRNNYSVAKH